MPKTVLDGVVRVESYDDDAFWRVVLNRPAENRIDLEMTLALDAVFAKAQQAQRLCCVLLVGAGEHFSLGGDPRELLPPQVRTTVPAFHRLVRRILETPLFLIAVVHGQCLGRGLELASLCNRVYAAPEARLGHPDMEMGVFPSVASLVLPERIGWPAASELCATRHVKRAEEAGWVGLVDHVVADPERIAITEIRDYLVPLSAASLRHAMRALGIGFRKRILAGLDEAEALYLETFAASHDAAEGVRALLEHRPPRWEHR